MEEWKLTRLGSLCKRVCSGGTPKSTIDEYYGGGIPWLNTKEINFNRIFSTESTISELGLINSSAKWVDKHAVIVAMYGATAAKCAIGMVPLTTNQACCNLMIDENLADYRFVYYSIVNSYSALASLANGGAQQNLNAQLIKDFEIRLPALATQKRIADILSSIDDKIEINNRINHNLETLAKVLYKNWFVDFEPFKDGPFIESVLGMIPDGWRIYSLSQLMDIKRGSSPRPIQDFLCNNGLKWLKISDATSCSSPFIFSIQECIKEAGLKKTVYRKKGTLVLSNSATPGLPKFLGVDTCIHDGWLYFERSRLSNTFMYLMFLYFRDDLVSKANGSVFVNLKTEIVKNHLIALPPFEVLDEFDATVSPLFSLIQTYSEESDRLQEQRNALLSVLLSGSKDC